MFPRASCPPVEFPPPHTTQSTVKISCQQITSGLCWDFDRHTFIPPEDVFPGCKKCGRKESGEKIKRACCQLSPLHQAPGEREQVMLGPELRAVHQGPAHASSARPEKWMGAERSKRNCESQRRGEKKEHVLWTCVKGVCVHSCLQETTLEPATHLCLLVIG